MKDLATALAAAQAEFGTVPQNGFNPYHKTKYSTMEDYINAAKPILAKHGLSISQMPNLVEGQFVLTTILMHKSGDNLVSNQPIFSAKQDAQSMGSAITYARRYSYGSVLGMASGDYEDDGLTAAGKSSDKPKGQAPPRKQPAQTPAPNATPSKGQGSTNPNIEERVKAAPDLNALNELYNEVKDKIQALEKDKQDSVLDLFKNRKSELTKG